MCTSIHKHLRLEIRVEIHSSCIHPHTYTYTYTHAYIYVHVMRTHTRAHTNHTDMHIHVHTHPHTQHTLQKKVSANRKLTHRKPQTHIYAHQTQPQMTHCICKAHSGSSLTCKLLNSSGTQAGPGGMQETPHDQQCTCTIKQTLQNTYLHM